MFDPVPFCKSNSKSDHLEKSYSMGQKHPMSDAKDCSSKRKLLVDGSTSDVLRSRSEGAGKILRAFRSTVIV